MIAPWGPYLRIDYGVWLLTQSWVRSIFTSTLPLNKSYCWKYLKIYMKIQWMSNHHLRQSLLMLLKYPLAGAVGRVFLAAPLRLLLGKLHAPLLCPSPGALRRGLVFRYWRTIKKTPSARQIAWKNIRYNRSKNEQMFLCSFHRYFNGYQREIVFLRLQLLMTSDDLSEHVLSITITSNNIQKCWLYITAVHHLGRMDQIMAQVQPVR